MVFGRALVAALTAFAVASASTLAVAQPLPLWQVLDASEATATPAILVLDPARASEFPWLAQAPGEPAPLGGAAELGDAEINSFGCLIGGSLGMGASMYIGGLGIVNLIAGGLVPVQNPAALYLSLFGVAFATFCAVGQALTPLTVYTYKRYVAPFEAQMPIGQPSTGGGLRKSSLID